MKYTKKDQNSRYDQEYGAKQCFSSSRAHAQKGAFLPPRGGWGVSRDPIFEANLTILGVHARPQERLVVGGRGFYQALFMRGGGGGAPPPPPPPPPRGGPRGGGCQMQSLENPHL